jgi:uncharacterized protein
LALSADISAVQQAGFVSETPRRRILWFGVGGAALLIFLAGAFIVLSAQSKPEDIVVAIEWPDAARAPDSATLRDLSKGLVPAPDKRLIEASLQGLLPKIASDGTRAAELYARPVSPASGALADAPRIGIVLTGAGLGQTATVMAMTALPPEISLSLSPYGSDLLRQVADIRAHGHEVFLDLPLSSAHDGSGQSGPNSLSDRYPNDMNHDHLLWSLSQFQGYVGVTAAISNHLSQDGPASAVLADLPGRGLAVVDLASASKLVMLDSDFRPASIDAALKRLEDQSRSQSGMIGVAALTPLAIDRIRAWSASLSERGIRLVPVSALTSEIGIK